MEREISKKKGREGGVRKKVRKEGQEREKQKGENCNMRKVRKGKLLVT